MFEAIFSIFTGVGTFLIAVGLSALVRSLTLIFAGTAVEARVVDFETTSSRDSSNHRIKIYYPVVAYRIGSKVQRRETDNGASPAAFEIGDKVTVLFRKPDEIPTIRSFSNLWLQPIIFIGMGAMLIFFHLMLF